MGEGSAITNGKQNAINPHEYQPQQQQDIGYSTSAKPPGTGGPLTVADTVPRVGPVGCHHVAYFERRYGDDGCRVLLDGVTLECHGPVLESQCRAACASSWTLLIGVGRIS